MMKRRYTNKEKTDIIRQMTEDNPEFYALRYHLADFAANYGTDPDPKSTGANFPKGLRIRAAGDTEPNEIFPCSDICANIGANILANIAESLHPGLLLNRNLITDAWIRAEHAEANKARAK